MSWNPFRTKRRARTLKSSEEDQQSQKATDRGYNVAITLAFAGIIAVTAITVYVSYEAQLIYTAMIKGEDYQGPEADPSFAVRLGAAAWDVAAASFAVLALATAMRGDSPVRARIANLGCAVASLLMNGARIDLPLEPGLLVVAGHILVWMGPSLMYIVGTDIIVWEIQRRALQRRGKTTETPSMWSLIALLAQVVLGVLLWFVRLIFAPKETSTLFRRWFLAEVAYAPGRTVESDKARKALEQASQAQGFAEEVERKSAAAIAEAKADFARRANEAEESAAAEVTRVTAAEKERAEERIRAERERASAAITAERERANTAIAEQTSHVKKLEQGHLSERAQLEAKRDQALTTLRTEYDRQVAELESTVTSQQQDQERLRTELSRVRAEATQGVEYGRELKATRQQLVQEQQNRTRVEQRAAVMAQDQQELFARLSGRAQVEYLYTRLERLGDPRHGDETRVAEVAQEFIDRHGVALTPAKVVHYIKIIMSESGLADSSVTRGSGDSMGGAL
ncbi:hypothetical protein [Nocardiopsis sp. NPDC006938]|uniref:hypothetical protein n=1 Tax=Nocardiopsis sp. NPDC006938 TaxID=3364337 RepID=UPI0036AC9A0E